MKVAEADIARLFILARALKVWFFTMLSGSAWIYFEENKAPGTAEEFFVLLAGFGMILLFSLPVLFLTTVILSHFSVAEKRRRKVLRLFGSTLLINLFVYVIILAILPMGIEVLILCLGRFTLISILMMFLVNRDWIFAGSGLCCQRADRRYP